MSRPGRARGLVEAALPVLLGACGLSVVSLDDQGDVTTEGATTDGTEPESRSWRLPLGRRIDTMAPVGDALGNVYVIADRDSEQSKPSLIKVSPGGQVVWELELESIIGASAVAVGPSEDVWVCAGGTAARVSNDGALQWSVDDACLGMEMIAVGPDVGVFLHLRRGQGGGDPDTWEVLALDRDGQRRWVVDVGLLPPYEKNTIQRGTSIAGAAIAGTNVYVGCDICASRPAIAVLDLMDGHVVDVAEIVNDAWVEPYATVFEPPRVTSDGVWIAAYEDEHEFERKIWYWSDAPVTLPNDHSLPIEVETGITRRAFNAEGVQLLVDEQWRAVDFGSVTSEERVLLQNAEPAARGVDDSILMISVVAPSSEDPRTHRCWGGACRLYVVDAQGTITWTLDENVRLPYIGDRRVVYVDGNLDLVARETPLTPRTFGWSLRLANDHGNGCRGC